MELQLILVFIRIELLLEEILDQININEVYTYDVDIDFDCGVIPANNTVDLSVVECECGLDMPNVFTPDGNEINDYFKPYNNYEGESVDPENICMSTDFHMEIFNQWGRHIVSVTLMMNYLIGMAKIQMEMK